MCSCSDIIQWQQKEYRHSPRCDVWIFKRSMQGCFLLRIKRAAWSEAEILLYRKTSFKWWDILWMRRLKNVNMSAPLTAVQRKLLSLNWLLGLNADCPYLLLSLLSNRWRSRQLKYCLAFLWLQQHWTDIYFPEEFMTVFNISFVVIYAIKITGLFTENILCCAITLVMIN